LRDFLLSRQPENAKELARLGAAVRKLREERGLSQHEFAVAAGVGERRIRALEAGRLDPDYVLLVRLAKALGVRAGALVLRAEAPAGEERSPADPASEPPS
jgi:transcriptional regulator with XRE-family HTH domain